MKGIKKLREEIAKLQKEIKTAEAEKIKTAGKITLSFFKKESDLIPENFLKFKENFIKFLNEN